MYLLSYLKYSKYLCHALQHDVTVKIESLKKKGYVLTLLSEV